jgi:hypothetical protein
VAEGLRFPACHLQHPPLCQVTFTGSTSVGRGVGQKAGDALKTNTLELGGKSPVIVCPDVDIDDAVEVSSAGQGLSRSVQAVCCRIGSLQAHDTANCTTAQLCSTCAPARWLNLCFNVFHVARHVCRWAAVCVAYRWPPFKPGCIHCSNSILHAENSRTSKYYKMPCKLPHMVGIKP